MTQRKKRPQTPNAYLQYTGIGFQMMGALGICAWLGHLGDEKLNTDKPYVTIVAMLFGLGASMYLLLRSIKEIEQREKKRKEREEG